MVITTQESSSCVQSRSSDVQDGCDAHGDDLVKWQNDYSCVRQSRAALPPGYTLTPLPLQGVLYVPHGRPHHFFRCMSDELAAFRSVKRTLRSAAWPRPCPRMRLPRGCSPCSGARAGSPSDRTPAARAPSLVRDTARAPIKHCLEASQWSRRRATLKKDLTLFGKRCLLGRR